MKVLITTDAFSPLVNGVVTSTLNLYAELIRCGHEVKILALAPNRSSKKEKDVYYIRSFSVGIYPDARGTVSYRSKYIQEIINWKPDVIHTQTEFCTFFLAKRIAKKCNAPIVHTYHTLYEDYTTYFTKNSFLGYKCVATFSREVLKGVNHVIVPTKKVEDVLIKYGVQTPVSIVPTGIDLNRFKLPLMLWEKTRIKGQLGINLKHRVLVTVGRLALEKNIDELLINMKELLIEEEHITFLIVGEGPYRERLEEKVKELQLQKNVVFTGMIEQSQIYKYYKLGDVFISASTSETQGLTYIEAMANGLPVLCKKDKCIEDVVETDKNGYMYEGTEDFLDKARVLLNNDPLRRRLAIEALKKAELYSTELFGKNAEAVYNNLVGENKSKNYRFGHSHIS